LPVADANDAAAAVFAVVWRKVDRLPPEDEMLPWLYAVARNEVGTIKRSMRRLGRLRAKLDGQPVRHTPSPEHVVVRNAGEAGLLEAIGSLRPDDQEIIRLRAYEQLSHPEIAVVLGISVEAAKKRSARALKRLRLVLGEQWLVETHTAADPVAMAEHLRRMAEHHARVGLKRTRCASAMGNAVYDLEKIARMRPEEIEDEVRRFLVHAVTIATRLVVVGVDGNTQSVAVR